MKATTVTLALTCAVILCAGTLHAQGGTYNDSKYGYSVPQVTDWQAIPPQPTDEYIVAKWSSPREIRNLPAEMHIYVFNRKAMVAVEKDPSAEEAPESIRTYLLRIAPKDSYESWAKSDFQRDKMELKNPKKFKPKAPKDLKVEGLIYRTKRDSGFTLGGRPMEGFAVSVGIIRTEEVEYAIEIFYNEKEERKLQGQFESIIKNFEVISPSAAALATAPVKEEPDAPSDGYDRTDKTEKERARERAKEQVKRTPGWWYHETPRYVIVTNVEKKGNNEEFIRLLGRRLEAIRDQYEIDFPPAKPIKAVSIVRVCKDDKTYHDYGGPGGSAGYWFAPAEELVFYKDAGDKRTPFAVLSHEAFHQYIYYACGDISPHSWYNEGFGDYYSGARLTDDGKRLIQIDPFAWRRDTIKAAVREKSHVPLKELIRYTQNQYYAKADLCYAQGWSVIYFLNKGVDAKHPWKQILPTYLRVIQETRDKDKAVDVAFEGVDIEELEKAWMAFTLR